MKKIKWLLQVCFLAVFAFLFTAVLPQTARADFAERPVGFVVIDQDGGVGGALQYASKYGVVLSGNW